MLNDPYLDTIISLVLVYALLSILVSILLEAWNKRTKERGVFLQRIVFRLLDDPLNKNYGYLIYQHPIINKILKYGNSYRNYIPAEGFANALIDTLAEGGTSIRYTQADDGSFAKEVVDASLADRLSSGVRAMADSDLKRLLTNFMDRNKKVEKDTNGVASVSRLDLDALKGELGRWFDDHMDRAVGEFKSNQRSKLQILGFMVAIGLNVDSLHLAKVFLLDKDLRERMVADAEQVADRYGKEHVMSDSLSIDQYLRAAGVPDVDSLSEEERGTLANAAMQDSMA
ncbi:MAG TPA: hypothetical protein PK760_12865, partial [Flavobacteriales bacterium]|nr:hypothetical protein [Flavobacteriales bacterium]